MKEFCLEHFMALKVSRYFLDDELKKYSISFGKLEKYLKCQKNEMCCKKSAKKGKLFKNWDNECKSNGTSSFYTAPPPPHTFPNLKSN